MVPSPAVQPQRMPPCPDTCLATQEQMWRQSFFTWAYVLWRFCAVDFQKTCEYAVQGRLSLRLTGGLRACM